MGVGFGGRWVFWGNLTRRSEAWALMMPPPATISGRSALFNMAIAFSICAREALGLYTGSGSYVSSSNSISAICTSNGGSVNTAPRLPEGSTLNGLWEVRGTCGRSHNLTRHFETRLANQAL